MGLHLHLRASFTREWRKSMRHRYAAIPKCPNLGQTAREYDSVNLRLMQRLQGKRSTRIPAKSGSCPLQTSPKSSNYAVQPLLNFTWATEFLPSAPGKRGSRTPALPSGRNTTKTARLTLQSRASDAHEHQQPDHSQESMPQAAEDDSVLPQDRTLGRLSGIYSSRILVREPRIEEQTCRPHCPSHTQPTKAHLASTFGVCLSLATCSPCFFPALFVGLGKQKDRSTRPCTNQIVGTPSPGLAASG